MRRLLTAIHARNTEDKIRQAEVLLFLLLWDPDYFVKPHMIKDGAVLVDVGVSRVFVEDEGKWKIHGDIDPACYAKASAYTPNPGEWSNDTCYVVEKYCRNGGKKAA